MSSLRGSWCLLPLQLLLWLPLPATCALPAVLSESRIPGNLEAVDPQCWDSSSLALIRSRRLRVAADSVVGLWDFIVGLKLSQQQRHNELFLELAQLFWESYLDCVLSRSHGLGRRHVVSKKYTAKYSHSYAKKEYFI